MIIAPYVPHPITQTLIDNKIFLHLGLSRSVWRSQCRRHRSESGHDAATFDDGLGEVSMRIATGSRNIIRASISGPPRHGPGDRSAGRRFGTRVRAGNLPFTVPRGRLVCSVTGDLIGNSRIAHIGAATVFSLTP